jgi:electron transfer flavoprotein alpha subunit
MGTKTEREIWVYTDLRNERLFSLSLNVMARAHELNRSASGTLIAIIFGSSAHSASQKTMEIPGIPVYEAADRCLSHGADRVFVFENPNLVIPRADIYAPVLSHAVESRAPMLVLFPLTEFGRDLAARTARLSNAGLIADCVDLAMKDGRIVASCPSWGGEILAEITFTKNFHSTGFATVQPHGIQPVNSS